MSLEGQVTSHYRFGRLLGSGSMGEVYLATDTHVERQVAIKVIRLEGGTQTKQEAVRLFQREMKAIATLDHPHVLPLFDYGELALPNEVNLTYMVIPYRPEGSLVDWLGRQEPSGQISLQVTAVLISQAASALSHAHAHGIIHQDVKLANFLVQTHEGAPDQPHLLLADFGVAKMTVASFTASHAVRGTPLAMPPEQWAGQPVRASDQYALAVMAYQLLTGRPPFQGNLNRVMYQHLQDAPLPPSQHHLSLPLEIDAVLLKALAKKPGDRFASISDFARAFQDGTEQRPAQGMSASAWQVTEGSPSSGLAPIRAVQNAPGFQTALPATEPAVVPPVPWPAIMPTVASPLPLPPTVPKLSAHTLSELQMRRSKLRWLRLLTLALALMGFASVGGGAWLLQLRQMAALRSESIAHANASATALAQEQARYPYPAYLPSRGTLAFFDPLDQASPSHWKQSGGCSYKRGSLLVATPDPHYATTCFASGLRFTHLAYEVTMTILTGDKGGCLFDLRTIADGITEYYIFMVSQTGYYELYDYQSANSGTFSTLLSQTYSSAIHQGLNQNNLLTILATGDAIRLYVNKIKVGSISANISTAGTIGVFASSFAGVEDATEVAYQHVRVWSV